MVVAMQQIGPVAHWPLMLGVIRKRNVAALIDTCCPPHPAHVLACGRGVEALLLAILDDCISRRNFFGSKQLRLL